MSKHPAQSPRELILQAIADHNNSKIKYSSNLNESDILNQVQLKLGSPRGLEYEQAVLTQWNELFRTGLLAWGLNFSNTGPPFFHLTQPGKDALASLSRDPFNPEGYLRHISAIASVSPKAKDYLVEALDCFSARHYRAAAILLGVSAECEILRLRDAVVAKFEAETKSVPKDLNSRQLKTVLAALKVYFSEHAKDLREPVEANWSALAHQIRTSRNDAGHPVELEPITSDRVHASFLLFPELAKMMTQLLQWLEATPTSVSPSPPVS